MRILFLNHNLREHGTYFRAFHLARELVRLGHKATLWTGSPDHWYRPAEAMADGIRILETPSWNPLIYRDDGWGPIDIAYRMGRIVSEPYDLVYAFAHPPNVFLPAWMARHVRRKPLIVDWCDVYRDGIFPLRREMRAYRGERGWRVKVQEATEQIEEKLERRILRMADGVTVISQELERAALAEGVAPDRLLRFPSGANLDSIRVRDKAECRRELRIETNGPLLGYIANYNPDERFFLASLSRAMRRHPNAKLLSTAPPFTESLVEKEGLRNNLIELGRLPFSRMEVVLGASDILLLPLEDNASNLGRWPNKFGDYLAAGRPIVSNAVGDIANFFAPLESEDAIGIASPPTVEDFSDAIAALIDRPADWPRMGASARRLAETRLNWESLARTAEDFIKGFYP